MRIILNEVSEKISRLNWTLCIENNMAIHNNTTYLSPRAQAHHLTDDTRSSQFRDKLGAAMYDVKRRRFTDLS